MISYLLRRLFLIPVTLFFILLVNFVIINLAPGDPSTVNESAVQGDGMRQAGQDAELGSDDQYLLFREHYGLTLPILVNVWPSTSFEKVHEDLERLADRDSLSPKEYSNLRLRFGDRARYVMPSLLAIAQNEDENPDVRKLAMRYLVRGGTRMGTVGPKLTPEQRAENRKIATDNHYLRTLLDSDVHLGSQAMGEWVDQNVHHPSFLDKVKTAISETRFTRYFRRVLTLDFGTMRNDANRTVISEVGKRIKYSLTLAVFPMLITFGLCQVVGFVMALWQNRWPDFGLNVFLLVLYAIPVFVVAPFLIEKVALQSSLPISGFHSDGELYTSLTSWNRMLDVALHLFLPLIAVMYGTLAAQSRLSRTAVLEVLRQDYVRTARAKGLPPFKVLWKHVGRNAAITIVTSLAASLGIILGGSLIVETIFSIDGFGRFFYEAILNRDYSVILFSALAGAFLALIGYLIADIAYTFLDPRVTLD